ncbi:unnamed protein product [Candida verbasci]|uniref:COP9 signalosome complex subunit 5 n=1 Tax=Candida verbasci TaxID=1227364 RepID=A0A9W4TYI9_9ASCO|nr:unnamed protein product [Candida verbasci]
MPCYHNLIEAYEQPPPKESIRTKTINLYDLTEQQKLHKESQSKQQLIDFDQFYKLPPIDPILKDKKPWKEGANYFTKCYISSLALMKMTIHAQNGGSIEIMGMLMGKIITNSIIITDVYRLPVEGTETRVNAQNEAYEYMVSFLQAQQGLGSSHDENIVGWYHSHPGYGCWLSGIDVSTQELNQNFQDPYLAIVVDPIKTLKQGIVEIGAFRTYPKGYKPTKTNTPNTNINILSKNKRKDFGSQADKYYSLDIEIFSSSNDLKIIEILKNKDSISWLSNLLIDEEEDDKFNMKAIKKEVTSMELNKNFEFLNSKDLNINKLIEMINNLNLIGNSVLEKILNKTVNDKFEDKLKTKLIKSNTKNKKIILDENLDENEIVDEIDSDLEEMSKEGGDDDDEEEDEEYDEEEINKDDLMEIEEGSTRLKLKTKQKSRNIQQSTNTKRLMKRMRKYLHENSGLLDTNNDYRSMTGAFRNHGNPNVGRYSSSINLNTINEFKEKNSHLIELSRLIGSKELCDLITIDVQERLFT